MEGWIVSFVDRLGAWGVGLLMLLENVFPPIPSELIMPLAGFYARAGYVDLGAVIVLGSLGSLLGTCGWYLLGRCLGPARVERWVERHGRWLTISTDDVARSREWLQRHGWWALVLGRLVPGVRTVISLPAGMGGIPFPRFLLYSTIGTVAWTSLLALVGYALGSRHEEVAQVIGPVSWVVLGLVVSLYARRVWATRGRAAPPASS